MSLPSFAGTSDHLPANLEKQYICPRHNCQSDSPPSSTLHPHPQSNLVRLIVFAKAKMPIIIYPNLGPQLIGAVPAAQTAPSPPSALIRRGSGFSRTLKASLRTRSSSSLESSISGRTSRDTLADTYQLTRGASPLNTMLLPSKSRSPVYCVTTDVHPDEACATTHLWHFDRDRRSLRDVAWIRWSSNSHPVVGVVGVQMPVNDFLVKSKGLGFSSRNQSYSFISEVETYKWVPHSGIFDSKPASWRCMAATLGVPSSKQALLALYRPPTTSTHASSISGDHYVTSVQSFGGTTQLTPTSPVYVDPVQPTTSPAVLEIHDTVEKKAALRDIVVLTFLLVVVGRDDWRELPVGEPAQTSEVVFSRMMQDTYHPTWSCTTLPDTST